MASSGGSGASLIIDGSKARPFRAGPPRRPCGASHDAKPARLQTAAAFLLGVSVASGSYWGELRQVKVLTVPDVNERMRRALPLHSHLIGATSGPPFGANIHAPSTACGGCGAVQGAGQG